MTADITPHLVDLVWWVRFGMVALAVAAAIHAIDKLYSMYRMKEAGRYADAGAFAVAAAMKAWQDIFNKPGAQQNGKDQNAARTDSGAK